MTDETKELRKKLDLVQKRIGKAAQEKILIIRQLEEVERACIHMWEKRVYDKKLDKFTRTCELCGKTETSRGIETKF